MKLYLASLVLIGSILSAHAQAEVAQQTVGLMCLSVHQEGVDHSAYVIQATMLKEGSQVKGNVSIYDADGVDDAYLFDGTFQEFPAGTLLNVKATVINLTLTESKTSSRNDKIGIKVINNSGSMTINDVPQPLKCATY